MNKNYILFSSIAIIISIIAIALVALFAMPSQQKNISDEQITNSELYKTELNKNKDAQMIINNLYAQLNSYMAEIGTLQEESQSVLNEKNIRISQLHDQIQEIETQMQTTLNEKNARIAELSESVLDLNNQSAQMRIQYNATLTDLYAEIERVTNNGNLTISQRDETIRYLNEQLLMAQNDYRHLIEENNWRINDLNNTIMNLNNTFYYTMENQRNEIAMLNQSINSFNNDYEAMINSYNARIEELNNQIESLQATSININDLFILYLPNDSHYQISFYLDSAKQMESGGYVENTYSTETNEFYDYTSANISYVVNLYNQYLSLQYGCHIDFIEKYILSKNSQSGSAMLVERVPTTNTCNASINRIYLNNQSISISELQEMNAQTPAQIAMVFEKEYNADNVITDVKIDLFITTNGNRPIYIAKSVS